MWGRASSGITPASHRPSPLSLSLSQLLCSSLSNMSTPWTPLSHSFAAQHDASEMYLVMAPHAILPHQVSTDPGAWRGQAGPFRPGIRSHAVPWSQRERQRWNDQNSEHGIGRIRLEKKQTAPNPSGLLWTNRIHSLSSAAQNWAIKIYIYIFIFIGRGLRGPPFKAPLE